MTYKELKKLTESKTLPLNGTNEDGEDVIIEAGKSQEGERYFRTITAQRNAWLRINMYWEDGTTEELYRK